MIFRRTARASQQANLLLLTLTLSGILGVTLVSYLIMAQAQNISIFRSQNWNSTMVVTEAGIEDALQLINKNAGSFDDLWKWTNNVSADGWDGPNNNVYHVKRSLPYQITSGAWLTNSYEVWITNTNNEPSIAAVGSVPWTYQYAAAPQAMFAQIGSPAPATTMARKIFTRTHFDPLFVVAMAALGNIDLHGNNIATDSFDSYSTNYSNNGLYPAGNFAKIKDNGDVCTDSALINSLNFGNADIMGHVRTGPGLNTINGGPNGSVGDKYWVHDGHNGIQPGHSSTDFNVIFPDVVLPSVLWLPALPSYKTIDGTNYTYTFLTSGNYSIPNLSGSIYVGTNVNLKLRLTGSVNLAGQSVIRICAQNATLRMFMDGPSFSLSGNAYIDNQSGHADRCYLFGTPNCTSISFAGNGAFYGGVYAPNADFTLNGGGSDTWDFIGASVTKTVMMNGHYNFHFDENLSRIGPGRGYIVNSWEEK
ncbi:MAG TPA: collagen-binding domain-containing protein [Bacillota bacterium]|nr:collagen-binding domain-containing protein [Bacillota bacterium]